MNGHRGTTTMAAPQALTDTAGWQRDTAARNWTIADLARRLRRIRSRHVLADDDSPFCGECLRYWPCPTWLIANGDDTP